jgi:hypothetical protein
MTRSTFGRMAVAMMTAATVSVLASDARAACMSATPGAEAGAGRAAGRGAPGDARRVLQAQAATTGGAFKSHASIVGLWNTTFLFGDGPGIYDQGFQQWHADHTELMVDNAVPPSLGNVCVGVWKQTGPRTYTLKHMTFNWDAEGALAGTFVLRMTVTLERRGNVFAGTYTADSFDLEGKVIPELHVEGNVRAERIRAN